MKSSNATKFIIILLILAGALFLLYPTYQFNSMDDKAKDELRVNNQKEFFALKEKTINLGLDLQGGMYVILEVDIKELLDELAKNKTQEFTDALNETAQAVEEDDLDFISVFSEKLTEKGLNIARFYYSAERRDEGEVLSFLRTQSKEAVQRSLEILRNRVDQFGVSEPIIQKQGESRIIVQLAGVDDPTRVRGLIGKTAMLEFRLLKDNVVSAQTIEKINNYISSKISPIDTLAASEETSGEDSTTSIEKMFGIDSAKIAQTQDTEPDSVSSLFEPNMFFLNPNDRQTVLVPVDKEEKFKRILAMPEIQAIISSEAGSAEFLWASKPANFNDEYLPVYLVNKHTELTGSTITDAAPRSADPNDPNAAIGSYEVTLNLDDSGSRTFARVTGANIGKRLAIILDDKIYMAPNISTKVSGGRARITGINDMEEARDLSIVLKAGALPAPVNFMGERTVGPSLGQDSINAGSYSAMLGLLLVVIFMVIYYRLSGIVADIALILNIVFILAVMAYFHATLTLPGIAGIILTMGMSVDANVLIFERIREELRRGKTVRASLDLGYEKALVTILDANITTFIAGLVLYTFGTGPIQGFALTLMIGIAASMFTAIFVTRVIFNFILEKKKTINTLSI